MNLRTVDSCGFETCCPNIRKNGPREGRAGHAKHQNYWCLEDLGIECVFMSRRELKSDTLWNLGIIVADSF